ncbi:LICH-like protein [Mya arenaria]|uniref:Lipase n=1 Tax=Mya arenaria TaxID=6604 RepID=A0ABY7F1R7_MYAAR|nr:lysosomal acid lipase/cholesteryl ester hydrolase-like [Mya arenaria]WAR15129.1 LICH-like protein [Mya arenaria]
MLVIRTLIGFALGTICLALPTKPVQNNRLEPDVYRNTTELVRSKGYPNEEHNVITSDGYILQVQRIPRGRKPGATGEKGPVLLQHGLLSCSACWVENLANNSLGFIMADAGYDVWLGNSRGNTYGLKHKTLNANQTAFWDFSFDEMALLDLPATISYILNVTGRSKLSYIGHSQGTEIAFAALSRFDNLNDQIQSFVALGPAAYLGNMTSPVKLLDSLTTTEIYTVFGQKDFLPRSDKLPALCVKPTFGEICENSLFLLCGFDPGNLNKTRIPVYIGQHPAGTSVKNMVHYLQAVKESKFQMFDYGEAGNQLKYKQKSPPNYPLHRVRTKVTLYVGDNDWLTTIDDVNRLAKDLPFPPEYHILPRYNHLDYIWGMDAAKILYPKIVNTF